MIGLPVWDWTRIVVVTTKVALFAGFLVYFNDFTIEISQIVQSALLSVLSSSDNISSLDLGYFSGAIGLADFLNTLIASTFVALNFFVSGMLVIIISKYTLFVYSRVFNF